MILRSQSRASDLAQHQDAEVLAIKLGGKSLRPVFWGRQPESGNKLGVTRGGPACYTKLAAGIRRQTTRIKRQAWCNTLGPIVLHQACGRDSLRAPPVCHRCRTALQGSPAAPASFSISFAIRRQPAAIVQQDWWNTLGPNVLHQSCC